MTRRIATWAVIAIAALGLSACSGDAGTSETTSGTSVTSAPANLTTEAAPAPSETPESTVAAASLTEACIEPSARLVEASAQLTEAQMALAAAGTNSETVQASVDALVTMSDTFGAMAESSSHAEVKASLEGMQEGYGRLADIYERLLIDEDLTAAAEVNAVTTDLQAALTSFQELCTP